MMGYINNYFAERNANILAEIKPELEKLYQSFDTNDLLNIGQGLITGDAGNIAKEKMQPTIDKAVEATKEQYMPLLVGYSLGCVGLGILLGYVLFKK